MSEDNTKNARPAWLPEKFWDAKTSDVRVEALARSYQQLERAMSAHRADCPNDPRGYKINVDEALGLDDEVNNRLFNEGFTNRQAQLVYDLAGERLMPMVQQIEAKYENARQFETLFQHFGGQDRFEALRPQLLAWGEANLNPDVLAALSASAEGIIALHEMMQSREPGLNRGGSMPAGVNETDLKRMMADPRYWRERDPATINRVREGFRALYPDT